MGDLAQDGSNPQSTNPGTETPAGQVPGGQPSNPPEAKKEEPVGPDYKSFFEQQMQNRATEKQNLEAKLNDTKISREEKLNIKERLLDMRDEEAKWGVNKGPAQAPDLSFLPDDKRNLVETALKNVADPQERAAIIDYTQKLFEGVNGKPKDAPPPANLDRNKDGTPPASTEVRLNSNNLLGVNADDATVSATRAGFWDFLAGLKQ